jgi:L-lactate dehydrogenase complex protein LldG
MTDARRQILAGIRHSLGREGLDAGAIEVLQGRLDRHFRHIIPARVDLDANGLLDLFIAKARGVSATVEKIDAMSTVPEAVARYLASENLPARLVQAPGLSDIDWALVPTMQVRSGSAVTQDETSLTSAMAGIAETGTLFLASTPDTPTTLNFVPPTHIVVLKQDRVVGSYEDAWDLLRLGVKENGQPRVANFITGPSRTGDIEQKIEIGVHGPLRLHILVVEH